MWVAAGARLLGSSLAHAHGGVPIEFDTCVVEIGKHRMHFTAYQQATGGEEHCRDLPGPGKTILVFDFVDTEMRSKPVELKIVETGEGNEIVVAQLPNKVYPQGAVNLESEFEAGKRYMAVLTMSDARPVVLKVPIQVAPSQSDAALFGEPPEEFMSQPIIGTDAEVTVKEFIGDEGNTEWKKIEDNAWRLHSTELDKVTEKTRDIIMLFTRVEDGVEITRLIVDGKEHDRNTISHVVNRAVPLIIAAKYSGIWEYDENGSKSYVKITKDKSGRFKLIKGSNMKVKLVGQRTK
jgi:hypothetical protein